MSTNVDLFKRRQAAVARGVGNSTPLSAYRAVNAEIWDVEGRRYVDFAGGIAVVNTGHSNPTVVAAVQEQLERFSHTCFQVMLYEPYIELCEKLNALAPIAGPAKSILFSTGAEATENAIKIARAATGRNGVIAFTGGFHGRTTLAMNLTGKVLPYKKGMGSALPEIWHVPFPVESHGVTVADALRHIDFLFKADIDPSAVAAIIVEPVQGEGGFHQAPADLMGALRQICDTHGILLIADEVQTGFGRTGKMFAMEHYDVSADLVCVAKSLAGGFPLSGVIGRADIMDVAEPGRLGGTYAGNPLACAAALAVLKVFERDNLVDRANMIGERVKARLQILSRHNALVPIANIRGPGAMVAFDIVQSDKRDQPDADTTKKVIQAAYEAGLILLSCGTFANTIRILVPLTVPEDVLEDGLSLLERALAL